MKITGVKTFRLQHTLPHKIGVSTFMYQTRDTLLVKLTTDEGLVGWGETAPLGGVRGLIEDQLAPLLIGQDPRDHRRLWRELWGPNFGNGLAVAALDLALHDLWGKAVNQSVAQLYGGRLRDRVPAYASAMNYVEGKSPIDHYPGEAAALARQGYTAMKMRIGGDRPRDDIAAVAKVREAVGPDVKLMVDANGAYTIPTAVRVGKELEKLGIYWYEEPLPEHHYAGYPELADMLDIALAGGEIVDSRGAARDLIANHAFDIIQPDVSLCGGLREWLFIAEMAKLWGVWCVPHCWGGAITIAGTLQVLALVPDATWSRSAEPPLLELDAIENPFRDKIVKKPFELRNGQIDIPTTPAWELKSTRKC